MVSKCVVSCTTTDICYVCIRHMYTYICIHYVLLMWLTCDWHVSNQRPVFPCRSLNVVTYGSNCVQNAMIFIGKSHEPIFWSHTKSWDVEAKGLSGTKKKARGWVGVYSDLPAKKLYKSFFKSINFRVLFLNIKFLRLWISHHLQ